MDAAHWDALTAPALGWLAYPHEGLFWQQIRNFLLLWGSAWYAVSAAQDIFQL